MSPLRTYRFFCAALALLSAATLFEGRFALAADDSAVRSSPLRVNTLAVDKILFLGNSITLHGPSAGVWDGDWGMAASAKNKDYVHLLTARIAAAAGGEPRVVVKNIAAFERQFDSYDPAESLTNELKFNADLVVVAIGENVPALTSEADKLKFSAAFARLLNEVRLHGQPTVLVRSSFWADPAKDQIMRQACQEAGGVFVDIHELDKQEANYARSERQIEHAGVARHPGDKGMQAIADALWIALERQSVAR
jgi:hypothetical protein